MCFIMKFSYATVMYYDPIFPPITPFMSFSLPLISYSLLSQSPFYLMLLLFW